MGWLGGNKNSRFGRDMLGTVTKAAMKVISVPKEANELNDLLSIGYDITKPISH